MRNATMFAVGSRNLTPSQYAKIDRDLRAAEDKQALACARGIHPNVERGRCTYCSREVRA